MTCAHCCVSATKRGKDMILETYKATLALARQYDCYLTLGGGEPTLHPEFEHFLMLAIAYGDSEEYTPCVITNGKLTERALLLARLTKRGIVAGELSQDEWHDPIDYEVVKAFGRNVRDVTDKLINIGRAKALYKDGYVPDRDRSDDCVCPGWSVQPDGTIRQCGCTDAPIVGNVHKPDEIKFACTGDCHRSSEYREQMEWYKEREAEKELEAVA